MNLIGNCRLAALIKEGIQVQVLEQFMEEHVFSIWMKSSSKGNRKIHLGAVYWEHQWIRQDGNNTTKTPAEQLHRWKSFIEQWIAASRGVESIVIGDVNLDFNKWHHPDQEHLAMVDLVKSRIETLGFHQLVEGDTRFWRDTKSLLDHCWTEVPNRILQSRNEMRTSSDHNMIQFSIRLSASYYKPKEILLRDRINLNIDRFKSNVSNIDLTELL